MFQNMQVTGQPVFYLFLAATILLSLGYGWGKRRNTRIHLSAFNAVVDFLKPKDQQFTTIGGLTGYHGNIIPKMNKVIRRVDLTLTLLPRQSWLYMPFSWISMRSDHFYVTCLFGKKKKPSFGEGHLIETRFSKTRKGQIDGAEQFEQEAVRWGESDFTIYTRDEKLKKAFMDYIRVHPDPVTIKHIAFIPDEDKAYFYMIPKYGTVALVFGDLVKWISKTVAPEEKKQE